MDGEMYQPWEFDVEVPHKDFEGIIHLWLNRKVVSVCIDLTVEEASQLIDDLSKAIDECSAATTDDSAEGDE